MEGGLIRIGELAGQSGVSVRSLRYYEEQGLLYSTRSESGQRLYKAGAAQRVKLIQQLYAAGLTSKTLRELLPCIETPVEKYTPLLLSRLAEERDRIERQLTELARTRDRLQTVIALSAAAS